MDKKMIASLLILLLLPLHPILSAAEASVNVSVAGNLVIITGTDLGSGSLATVQIDDPDGRIYCIGVAELSVGSFATYFQMLDPMNGTYSVKVKTEKMQEPYRTTFTVGQGGPNPSPSPSPSPSTPGSSPSPIPSKNPLASIETNVVKANGSNDVLVAIKAKNITSFTDKILKVKCDSNNLVIKNWAAQCPGDAVVLNTNTVVGTTCGRLKLLAIEHYGGNVYNYFFSIVDISIPDGKQWSGTIQLFEINLPSNSGTLSVSIQ